MVRHIGLVGENQDRDLGQDWIGIALEEATDTAPMVGRSLAVHIRLGPRVGRTGADRAVVAVAGVACTAAVGSDSGTGPLARVDSLRTEDTVTY